MPLVSPESVAAIVSVPAAAAVIVTVALFLRHIKGENERNRLTWENHLSKAIDTQVSTTKVLTDLVAEVRELRRDIK